MIREFTPGDILNMDMLDCYLRDTGTVEFVMGLYEASEHYLRTLLSVRGDVVAVFGGLIEGRNMSVWAAVDKLVSKYPVLYHRTIKEDIERMAYENNILRVQSIIFADNERAYRQHLMWGFSPEGVLKKRGPGGEDQVMFARIF